MLFTLGVNAIARLMDLEPADLSTVEDPKGRLDYLASRLVDRCAKDLPADLQATYQAARPLIDGYFVKTLGSVKLQVPDAPAQGKAA